MESLGFSTDCIWCCAIPLIFSNTHDTQDWISRCTENNLISSVSVTWLPFHLRGRISICRAIQQRSSLELHVSCTIESSANRSIESSANRNHCCRIYRFTNTSNCNNLTSSNIVKDVFRCKYRIYTNYQQSYSFSRQTESACALKELNNKDGVMQRFSPSVANRPEVCRVNTVCHEKLVCHEFPQHTLPSNKSNKLRAVHNVHQGPGSLRCESLWVGRERRSCQSHFKNPLSSTGFAQLAL